MIWSRESGYRETRLRVDWNDDAMCSVDRALALLRSHYTDDYKRLIAAPLPPPATVAGTGPGGRSTAIRGVVLMDLPDSLVSRLNYHGTVNYQPARMHLASQARCPCNTCPRRRGCVVECQDFKRYVGR